MHSKLIYGLGFSAACGVLFFASESASAGAQGTAIVRLQASTPGATQTGHLNISGTGRFGTLNTNNFTLATGGASGRFLVSNASGVGSWQDFAIPLPYAGVGVANNTVGLFKITNNGTQGAIEGRNQSGAFGKLGGESYGAYGEHGSSFNRGSLGNSDNGVSGSNNVNPSYGYLGGSTIAVYGEHGSTSGTAIRARSYATTGGTYGVNATVASPAGIAIHAENLSTVSGAVGIWTKASLGPSGTGIKADASLIGVDGSGTGSGVVYGGFFVGDGTGARGIYASASGAGTKYGVRGAASGTGTNYGVYSVNDLGTGGSKQFVIDHPLDPLNKYLKHYCSEGPAPMNEYSGTITTDENGYAWVELPTYFHEINKNPRYVLTVVDGSDDFVMAKISKELSDRRFQIRTSKPTVKVCWVVKAERNDAWMRANPPKVEVDKDENERGKYQNPELFGAPASMGMDYRPARVSKKK